MFDKWYWFEVEEKDERTMRKYLYDLGADDIVSLKGSEGCPSEISFTHPTDEIVEHLATMGYEVHTVCF